MPQVPQAFFKQMRRLDGVKPFMFKGNIFVQGIVTESTLLGRLEGMVCPCEYLGVFLKEPIIVCYFSHQY